MPDDGRDIREQALAGQAAENDAWRRDMVEHSVASAEATLSRLVDPVGPIQFASYELPPSFVLSPGGLFTQQWYLENTGQSGGTAGVDLNVVDVWDDYSGAGVIVGVVDDGIQYTQSDINANYNTSIDWDGAGHDSSPLPVTIDDNHGTAVAGIIAAENNGTGTIGVAWDATLAAFRTDFSSITQIADLFARQINVDVSNNSWGAGGFYDNINDPAWQSVFGGLSDAALQGRGNLGTVFVFAAGNGGALGDNVNFHNLQNSPFTITVGAHDHNGIVTNYSTPGAALLVSAPSSENNDGSGTGGIVTTDRTGSSGYASGDYVTDFGATSAAAPMVSGIVALMLEANPNLGYRDVQEILAYSASRTDAANASWQFNGAANWNGGGLHTSTDYGFGAVDALAAVRLAESWTLSSTWFNLDDTLIAGPANRAIADLATTDITVNVTADVHIDHVELFVEGSHTSYTNLDFILISPEGTESLVGPLTNIAGYYDPIFDGGADFFAWSFSSTQFWGEMSAGTWTLRIEDAFAGDSGTLQNWYLRFYGDASSDDIYVYTDEFAGFTGGADVARRSLTDVSGSDAINAAAVTTASDIDLNAGATSTIAGNSLTTQAGTTIENAYGGDGGDTITGNGADNILSGGRGNDTLSGGAGNDRLEGGAGNDALVGGDGTGDVAVYGRGHSSGFTFANLGAGLYQIVDISHGCGTDTLSGIEFLDFTAGEGLVFLSSLVPTFVEGTSGDDVLAGTSGADQILGLGGNDVLIGGGGGDVLDGGAGLDFASYESAAASITADLASPVDNLGAAVGDIYISIENLRGSIHADILRGDTASNHLVGGAGNDLLQGGGGNDDLYGDAGDDTLDGGDGNDTLIGGAGFDQIAGGDGTDTAVYAGAENNYWVVDFGAGEYTIFDYYFGLDTDALSAVEFLQFTGSGQTWAIDDTVDFAGQLGSSDVDTITGTGGRDFVDAFAGNDALIGGDGDDYLFGNNGDDVLVGGAGADELIGGDGNDTASYATATAGVYADLTYVPPTGGTGPIQGQGIFNPWDPPTDRGDAHGDTFNSIENLIGSDYDDWLRGNGDDNWLTGGAGNDFIRGVAGTNTAVYAGVIEDYSLSYTTSGYLQVIDNAGAEGTDLLSVDYLYFAGSDLTIAIEDLPINGTSGDDTLIGTSGDDIINGFGGNDWLDGDAGNDTLNGGTGTDTAFYTYTGGWSGTAFTDYTITQIGTDNWRVVDLVGFQGTDTLTGIEWIEIYGDLHTVAYWATIRGTAGTDNLSGTAFADTILSGDGNDILTGRAGGDTLDGAIGSDTASYADAGAVVIASLADPSANTGDAAGDSYVSIENLTGSAHDDWLTGDADANVLDGSAGEDVLDGGLGDDTLIGGAGVDTVLLAGAREHFTFTRFAPGVVTVTDAGSNPAGPQGTKMLIGVEVVQFSEGSLPRMLLAHLVDAPNMVSGSSTTGNNIAGNARDENVMGGSEADSMHGGDGSDTLHGDDGDDMLDGGTGDDALWGGSGADRMIGAGGLDYLDGGDGDDDLDGGSGDDMLFGGDGNDTLDASSGNDYLSGGSGDDLIRAGSGSDILHGDDDDDRLIGASGDDTLTGGGGNDFLFGGAGNDLLAGDDGVDWLYGDSGDDTFVFAGGDGDDTIADFTAGAASEDTIDVSDFGYADFAAVLADIVQVGSDAVLNTASDDSLTLNGVDRSDLHQDDFAL